VSAEGDLHRVSHDIRDGYYEQAIKRLLKVVAVLAGEVQALKAGRCEHQSAPEPGESTQHPDSCW
jgi:hypothetical protein